MSGRRKKKRKPPPPAVIQKGAEPIRKPRWNLKEWFFLVATIIGLPSAILFFWPRVMVSAPSTPLDPNEVLSTSFEVSNAGVTPLEHVTVVFSLGQVSGKGVRNGVRAKLDRNFIPDFNGGFAMRQYADKTLRADEQFTVILSDFMGNVESADIALIVQYQPWFLPIDCEKKFRFITYKHWNGIHPWQSWPLDEKLPPDAE